jgi:hypothetical protein
VAGAPGGGGGRLGEEGFVELLYPPPLLGPLYICGGGAPYPLPMPALGRRLGVKMERIIFDRPTDRRLTERKNRFSRIVAGYGHGYG